MRLHVLRKPLLHGVDTVAYGAREGVQFWGLEGEHEDELTWEGLTVSLPSPHCRTWAAFPQVVQKHCLQRGTKNLWKTQTCLFPYNSAERQANRVLKLTGSALFFLKKKEENHLVSATSQA